MNQTLQILASAGLYITLFAYFIAMVFYWFQLITKNKLNGQLATAFTVIGWVGNTIILVARTILAHRLPLANGYEFILTFCWGTVLIYLFIQLHYRLKELGAFVMPIPFLLLSFVVITMGSNEMIVQAIPPALKSNWLTLHVLTAIFSYGAFAVSFGLAVLYLFKAHSGTSPVIKAFVSRVPDIDILDELSYKIILFAFSFLTLVIITGAIWAEYAWGTYWSWDPKETWSLITWIIYAVYLHARLMHDWKGKRAAWLAIIGFAAVLFTFFGVNYFLPGLHSYA